MEKEDGIDCREKSKEILKSSTSYEWSWLATEIFQLLRLIAGLKSASMKLISTRFSDHVEKSWKTWKFHLKPCRYEPTTPLKSLGLQSIKKLKIKIALKIG